METKKRRENIEREKKEWVVGATLELRHNQALPNKEAHVETIATKPAKTTFGARRKLHASPQRYGFSRMLARVSYVPTMFSLSFHFSI